jgi:hypothetical protein
MPKARLIDRWAEWDDANPEFYSLFEKFSLEAAAAGHRRLSAWLVVNRIRWERQVHCGIKQDFAIPNDFIALFARKFMKYHPQHEGFFERRPLTRVTPQELKDCL